MLADPSRGLDRHAGLVWQCASVLAVLAIIGAAALAALEVTRLANAVRVFYLAALVAALGLGAGAVAVTGEYRRRALTPTTPPFAGLGVPVLASVPHLFTSDERRRRRTTLALAAGAVASSAATVTWVLLQ